MFNLSNQQTVWFDWDEWKLIYQSLYSNDKDKQSFALKRIGAWKSRGTLPVAVEATGALVEALLNEDRRSETENISIYAVAFNRLVNGFTENEVGPKNMFTRAEVAGMPIEFVDLRHQISHGRLPSVALLRTLSRTALMWTEDYYWRTQMSKTDEVSQQVQQTFDDYKERSVKLNGQAHQTFVSSTITTLKEIGMFDTIVIPKLVESLVKETPIKSTEPNNNNNNNPTNTTLSNISIKVYSPLLESLNNLSPTIFYSSTLYLLLQYLAERKTSSKKDLMESAALWMVWIVENLVFVKSPDNDPPYRSILESLFVNHSIISNRVKVLFQSKVDELNRIRKLEYKPKKKNKNKKNNADLPVTSYKQILKEYENQPPQRKWRRISNWHPCPIGILPFSDNSNFDFPPELDQFKDANFVEMEDPKYQSLDFELINNLQSIHSKVNLMFPNLKLNNNLKIKNQINQNNNLKRSLPDNNNNINNNNNTTTPIQSKLNKKQKLKEKKKAMEKKEEKVITPSIATPTQPTISTKKVITKKVDNLLFWK